MSNNPIKIPNGHARSLGTPTWRWGKSASLATGMSKEVVKEGILAGEAADMVYQLQEHAEKQGWGSLPLEEYKNKVKQHVADVLWPGATNITPVVVDSWRAKELNEIECIMQDEVRRVNLDVNWEKYRQVPSVLFTDTVQKVNIIAERGTTTLSELLISIASPIVEKFALPGGKVGGQRGAYNARYVTPMTPGKKDSMKDQTLAGMLLLNKLFPVLVAGHSLGTVNGARKAIDASESGFKNVATYSFSPLPSVTQPVMDHMDAKGIRSYAIFLEHDPAPDLIGMWSYLTGCLNTIAPLAQAAKLDGKVYDSIKTVCAFAEIQAGLQMSTTGLGVPGKRFILSYPTEGKGLIPAHTLGNVNEKLKQLQRDLALTDK